MNYFIKDFKIVCLFSNLMNETKIITKAKSYIIFNLEKFHSLYDFFQINKKNFR